MNQRPLLAGSACLGRQKSAKSRRSTMKVTLPIRCIRFVTPNANGWVSPCNYAAGSITLFTPKPHKFSNNF